MTSVASLPDCSLSFFVAVFSCLTSFAVPFNPASDSLLTSFLTRPPSLTSSDEIGSTPGGWRLSSAARSLASDFADSSPGGAGSVSESDSLSLSALSS